MTDRAPIPAEAFDDAIERLDHDALAAFVGRLETAVRGGDVEIDVDPPVVTVDDGGDRERILVDPDEPDLDTNHSGHSDGAEPGPDAVVVRDGSSTTDRDVPVRTTADLRQQLLYAVPPDVAESIAEAWLGTPVRAASYVPEPTQTAPADGETAGVRDEQRDSPTPESGVASEPSNGSERRTAHGRPDQSGRGDDLSDGSTTRNTGGLAVVGAVVMMLFAVTGGVVYAAEVSPDGDAGAFAAPASFDTVIADSELRQRSRDPIDESGAITTSTPMPGEGHGSEAGPASDDTEADRNVRLAPTCERSFLHVVQIQLNALKYNNNTTNDGIRTVRRFASPRNRQIIRTFDEFARTIKSPTYSPMLTYDSVQYDPLQSSDDFAQVQVITREDGNTTGQYYFRLRKIEDGEYSSCWMTDAVVSIPETNEFSGKVAGRSTGSVNGTS